MVFAVIGRAMLCHIHARSDSPTALYVDDFIMLTLIGRGVAQQKLVGDAINGTFPGAATRNDAPRAPPKKSSVGMPTSGLRQ